MNAEAASSSDRAVSAHNGKIAVVTGGTGAIGSAICARLQSLGMNVVAADRDTRAVPDGQQFFACDVTEPGNIEDLLSFASGQGPITCLVAAHGILLETTAGSSDLSAASKIIDVNLKSVA